jgi:ubiquinone/menaquinone biosynthesis C-methylase UbiE
MERVDEGGVGEEQAKLWNGTSGRAWVDGQAVIDAMFKSIEDLLVETVHDGPGGRVLDIGCGTGSTTLAAARSLGTHGRCVGIDISEPMITAARARAEREGAPVSFIVANAQSYPFEPASFDIFISRFGVMFFEDSVRAFANLRRAACNGARMRFVAWRSPAENPFMTTAERAVAPLLPDMPPRRSGGPGQFAFADARHVRRILEESGWSNIDIQPIDVPCVLPESELSRYFTRFGPLGSVLPQLDDQTRARIVETVRRAFEPYVHGAEVRFTAACWNVDARAVA